MSVKVVRMLSGEDVLCVCEDKGDYLEVDDSVVIVPTQSGTVQFVPYSPFSTKDPLQVNKEMVVFIADAESSLSNQHKQMFGGIVTPTSNIIA